MKEVVKIVTACLSRWPEQDRKGDLQRTIQRELDEGWTLRTSTQCGALIYLAFTGKEGLR